MNLIKLHKGKRLSQVAIYNKKIYTSGIVADDTNTDVEGQTGQILDKIDSYLKESDSNKKNIIYANIWLADIKDYDAMNSIWDMWVPNENPPCRACVEAKLASPKYKVEISIIAAVGD